MTKGCKIWLWLLIVGGVISVLSGFYVFSYSTTMGVYTVVVGAGQSASVAVLLFKQKKAGFYALCMLVVINFIYNIMHQANLLFALANLIGMPGITFFFLNRGQNTKKLSSDKTVNTIVPPNNSENYNGTANNYASTDENMYSEQNGGASTADSAYTSQSRQTATDSNKTNNFSGNKTSFFGSAKKMDVTVDFYKELDIDRAWDEKTIREHLKNMEKIWIQRQGATNDKEQSLLIDKIIDNIRDARRYLTKAAKRQAYDQALELAYQTGRIVDVAEEKLHTILDQAKAYYRKGNIKLAVKFAEEAVAGEVNDVSAYNLLACCYFDMNTYDKALEVIDHGISIFKTDLKLHWLGARIAIIGTKNFENAQQRINRLIELAPDNSIGHSEQIYLHLRSGDEKLAFQEIDSYIAAHPDDNNFKRGVAYDLDTYSNTCYYYDAAQNATFIADKASYQKCLTLRTKAVEIFEDEHTQNQLESAKYYGKKEWNDWNMPAIKSLATYGTAFMVLGAASRDFLPIGIALYLVMGILIYFSFRPYWQINKSYVTGQAGNLEKFVSIAGDATARIARITFNALVQIITMTLKFIIDLMSGRWF